MIEPLCWKNVWEAVFLTAQSRLTLDPSKPQEVKYCIPLWLRDQQIKQNCERVSARIEPHDALQTEPCAIVCYGPSLNETWEQIRQFKYIFSCSGSHKFLIDRGIIPTWHVEVDPRPHKIALLGPPHPDVEYLIASACSPLLVDHLKGFNVKLWHVFDATEEVPVLPRGDWLITGGCGVGLRAMTIARFFGFQQQHIFGMDGCEGPTGKHAGAHPLQAKEAFPTEYRGKTYHTTPAFLEAARMTFHELNQLKDVDATFYGEGLVQAMAKDYVRQVPPGVSSLIAFNRPILITPEFQALNQQLHRDNVVYGISGQKYTDVVISLVEKCKIKSVLDYGCGKGTLADALPFPIWEYDPAIENKDRPPRPADLVICTDVLEHIEPDCLDYVLDDIRRCLKVIGYFTIHMGPAEKCYADGRNTHLTQQDETWWVAKLSRFFQLAKVIPCGPELHVIAAPRQKKERVPEANVVSIVDMTTLTPAIP